MDRQMVNNANQKDYRELERGWSRAPQTLIGMPITNYVNARIKIFTITPSFFHKHNQLEIN